MKGSAAVSRVKVSADGHGVVPHAGAGMLRELADLTGLSSRVTAALADTYRGPWIHAPGDVFADLVAAVADGADCVDGAGQLWVIASTPSGRLRRRPHCGGASMNASTPLTYRRSGPRGRRPGRRRGRPGQRRTAGGGCIWTSMRPSPAIIPITSRTRRRPGRTFGFHPLLVFLDRPEIAGGEALAGLLRAGNAGSNTAADHITVLGQALAALPVAYRPNPEDPMPRRW